MARLSEALSADTSGYIPMQRADEHKGSPPLSVDQPGYNPMVRCPMPPISVTSDSLRQFYRGTQVPQTRLLTAATSGSSAGSSGGTVIQNTTVVSSSTTSTTSTSNVGKVLTASFITPSLDPNGQYTGVILMSKSFMLQLVTSNGIIARSELYATAAAQSQDLSRPYTTYPDPASSQGIISDVVVTAPTFSWEVISTLGANGDDPQTGIIYITVQNLDVVSAPVTITLSYLVLGE